MMNMVVRRVKKILAWLLSLVIVFLLFAGAWWVLTLV